jgi:hypothetical protein
VPPEKNTLVSAVEPIMYCCDACPRKADEVSFEYLAARSRLSRFNSMLELIMKTKLPVIALAALLFLGLPLASSNAYVGVSVGFAPPAIPVYTQPYCPGPGYLWTPGYWDWNGYDYYWIPGTWVLPPRVGFLWTPGYWGYNNGLYAFNNGYWGPTVGFYGGINYGYGYGGRGYYGGRWAGNTFLYNTAVTHVNRNVITNTYADKQAVAKNTVGSRSGFNGPGGARLKPNAREQAAAKAEHIAPTSAQRSRAEAAKKDPALSAKNNKGKPKAEAVRALNRENGQQTADGANANRAGAAGHNGNKNRAAGEKKKGKAVNTGNHQAANAHRTAETATPKAHKAEHARSGNDVRKVSSAHQAPRHVQTSQHHAQVKSSQPTRGRQAGPAPRGHGPAGQGPQQGKKKKKGKGQDGH